MNNPTNNGIATYIDRSSRASELDFVIDKRMREAFHFFPVIVSEINDDGTIDVIPLLFKTTANGENQRRAPVYNVIVPEIRVGNMAIIAMPKVGQKGFIKIADRDISKIKRTNNYSDVGSYRRFSLSDAIWDAAGSTFNDPAQYKIEILDGGVVNCEVTEFNIIGKLNVTGDTDIQGNVTTTGTLKNNDIDVGSTHTHDGVETGEGNTGVPN
jgi:hypothetical protein